MELEDTAASHVSIGFPLVLALLFACLLLVSVFFCCLLHWKKLQSLLQSSSGAMNSHQQPQLQVVDSTNYYPQKPAFPVVMMKQNYGESLPVLMPGDEIPKFIAMACPCQLPKEERIAIHVQKEASSDFSNGA